MLVVDRVELIELHELQEVGELERRHAVRLEQARKARHEVIDVRHVRQHIVRNSEVRTPAGGDETPGHLLSEELLDDLNAFAAGRLRRAGGRLDPEARNAARHTVLKQVAVVRRDLDDPGVRPEAEALGHGGHITFRVLQPGRRERAEVGIVR